MLDSITSSPTEESIKSLIPLLSKNSKEAESQHKYLSLRYSGFSHIEALRIAVLEPADINKWLKNPLFAHYEGMIYDKDFRHTLRDEVGELVFYRNYYLIMMKDAEVLGKATGTLDIDYTEVDDDGNIQLKHGSPPLTSLDKSYLLQIRKEYSPTQIAALRKLLDNSEPKNANTIVNIIQNQLNVRANK